MNSINLEVALAAVPMIPAGAESHGHRNGMLRIRCPIIPRSRVARQLNRWFQREDYSEVRLDLQGAFFWQQIDGRRSLDEIARNLATRFYLSVPESREAVIVFTKMLMTRQLIRLQVSAKGISQ